MKKSVICLLPLCLLVAACSTTRVPRLSYIQPSAALLVPCIPPKIRESRNVRDLVNNSNARQVAWESCNARHQALIEWHEELRTKGDTTTDGEKSAQRSSP